jgi:hypothetical protein
MFAYFALSFPLSGFSLVCYAFLFPPMPVKGKDVPVLN